MSVDDITKKLDEINLPWPVTLSIGGDIFLVSRRTLLRDTGSLFHAMLSSDKVKPKANGTYFINRDSTHFRYILNYLRTGVVTLPENTISLNELLIEAQYYQLQGIIDELTKPSRQIQGVVDIKMLPKAFAGSMILNTVQRETLVGWLGEEREYRLLYRGSRDGWDVGNFHFLCDNKGPTVTVIRRGSSLFGGYTEQSWAGSGSKTDPKAFLFTLVNGAGLGPKKLALKESEEEQAIFCSPNEGPVFGQGRDLAIADHSNINTCRSRLDNTYKCPEDQVPTLFLAGTLTFRIAELEVYGIVN